MKSSFLRRLFSTPITSRKELLEIIKTAAGQNIFDRDSLPLIEAALQFGDMRAKDIVLPRHEVDFININSSVSEILQIVQSTGHSRFPVVDGNLNQVIGIFHSKDIVQYILNPEGFELRGSLRQAMFIPDMKPLDSLLYEMRLKHSHMAIVVDEFTNVAGVITLEMIVEQIIGDIDDEHDSPDEEHAVIEVAPNEYRIKGYCGLERFNLATGLDWQDEQVESLGGYVSKHSGRIPASGEELMLNGCLVEITNADSRKINLLKVTVMKNV